jgi:hypothetical protein
MTSDLRSNLYLRNLQIEQKAWVKYNFGARPSYMPLLGVVEELGEYEEALLKNDKELVMDSIADMTIFLSDYCSAKKWDIRDIVQKSFLLRDNERLSVTQSVAKLCHHHLKSAQNIRGSKAQHNEKGMWVAASLLYWLGEQAKKELPSLIAYNDEQYYAAAALGQSENFYLALNILVKKVWSEVKTRDWRKNDFFLFRWIRRLYSKIG